ncbi:MAG: nucleotidyltransferase domain-containing protein [Patescibacteria group bacterium]
MMRQLRQSKKKALGKEVDNIVFQIKNSYKPEKIILFGSYAHGRQKENSDVDIVVIKNTNERPIRRMMRMATTIKSPLGADILVYTPREWNKALKDGDFFVKEIADNGKVIYGQ